MNKTRDIKLVYTGSDSRTHMGFGNSYTTQIKGIQTLLQRITKLLLTQIGSDLFSPNAGSNVPTYTTGSTNSEKEITSYINLTINQIEDGMKAEQADLILPDEERLISLNLQNVENLGGQDWFIEIFVKNAKNDSYVLRI